MKTSRTVLILAVLLALAGTLAWKFLPAENSKPIPVAVAQPSLPPKPIASPAVAAVEVPKVAPVVAKADYTPPPVSDQKRAIITAFQDKRRQELQTRLENRKPFYEKRIASATDDAMKAGFQKDFQDEIARIQKWTDMLSQPPEDIGEVQLVLGDSHPITLASGKSFTVRVSVTPDFENWTVILSEQQVDGAGATSTSSHSENVTAGQPKIMLLYDSTEVMFTPVGPDSPPPPTGGIKSITVMVPTRP